MVLAEAEVGEPIRTIIGPGDARGSNNGRAIAKDFIYHVFAEGFQRAVVSADILIGRVVDCLQRRVFGFVGLGKVGVDHA